MGGRGRPKKNSTKVPLAEFITTASRKGEAEKQSPLQGALIREKELSATNANRYSESGSKGKQVDGKQTEAHGSKGKGSEMDAGVIASPSNNRNQLMEIGGSAGNKPQKERLSVPVYK